MSPLLREPGAERQAPWGPGPACRCLLTALLVAGGARAAAPIALDVGQSLGPTAAASWAVGDHLRVGGRVAVGLVQEFDPAWTIEHTELLAMVTGEVSKELAPGGLYLGAALGPAWVFEDRARHQAGRLGGSATELGDSKSMLGVHGALRAGIRLDLWRGLGMSVGAGPTADWLPSGDRQGAQPGWSGALEVTWAP